MPVLGPLAPTNDEVTTANVLNQSNGTTPLWFYVKEDPDVNPNDTSYFASTNENGTEVAALGFGDMPADFGSMTSIECRIRTNVVNFNDDTGTLSIRIMDSTGTVEYAGLSNLGGWLQIRDNNTLGFQTSTALLQLTPQGEAASRADWNACRLYFQWVQGRVMGGDGGQLRVISLELNGTYDVAASISQGAWRLRSDDSQALNADAGWAAALNTGATLLAEEIFRLRVEVESDGAGTLSNPTLQYRRNAGAWTEVPTYPGVPSSATAVPGVSLVQSAQFVDNAATTNVLAGSAATFHAGSGQEDNTIPNVTFVSAGHTEFEFALLIRKLFEGGEHFDGDTFEFRVVQDGTPLSSYGTFPSVTLNTDNVIGGCWAESPHRVGPVADGNGNLYLLIEEAELTAKLQMMKSTDGGTTWVAMDTANRPLGIDLEGADLVLVGDRIYISHVDASDDVLLHVFRNSTHATNADTWEIVDEVVQANVTRLEQWCSLERRSDGTIVCFYSNAATSDKIVYKIRSAGGVWGAEQPLDTGVVCYQAVTALGASDTIHILYADHPNTTAYHRTLSSADVLSGRQSIATDVNNNGTTRQPLLPPVIYDDGGVEVVSTAYTVDITANLKSVQLRDGVPQTPLVIGSSFEEVDVDDNQSRQANASLAVSGTTLYCFYSPVSDNDLYYRTSEDGAAWSTTATPLVTGVELDAVRSAHVTAGGSAIGVFYEKRPDYHLGTSGFTGGARYTEVVLAAGTYTGSISQTMPSFTQSGTGTVVNPTSSGSIEQTLPAFSQSGTGTVEVPVYSGTADQTMPSFSQSATGTVADPVFAGPIGQTMPSFTQSGTGTVGGPAFDGTIDQTLPAFGQSATGTVEDPVYSGTADQTMPSFTQAATGTVTDPVFAGPIDQTMPSFTQSGTGTATAPGSTGSINQTMPSFGQSATGTVADPEFSGSINQTLPAFTQDGTGTATAPGSTGSIDQTMPSFSQSATGSVADPESTGSIDQTLPAFGQSATGTVANPEYSGAISQTMPSFGQSGTGATFPPGYTGSITTTLPSFTQSAVGTVLEPEYSGSITTTMPSFTQSATGSVTEPEYSGAISQTMPSFTQVLTGRPKRNIDVELVNVVVDYEMVDVLLGDWSVGEAVGNDMAATVGALDYTMDTVQR